MVVSRCKGKGCRRLVWFWQDSATLTLQLKNGKTKKVRLCMECGLKVIAAAGGNE